LDAVHEGEQEILGKNNLSASTIHPILFFLSGSERMGDAMVRYGHSH